MKNAISVEVESRELVGSGNARRLRHSGKIPAVVYGSGREAVGVTCDPRPIEAVLSSERGLRTLIQMKLAGRELKRMVMIKQTQRHPATEALLHVDFMRVEMDKKIDIDVPIHLTGEAEGVKNEGGMLENPTREVQLRVLPSDIPDFLEIDVSALHIGQSLQADDIDLPEGVELMSPPSETIVTVVAPPAVEEEKPEGEEDEAEAEEGADTPEGGAEEAPSDDS